MKAILRRFFDDEAVLDRIAMIAVVGNSYQRCLNRSVSRLSDWTKLGKTTFALQPSRPNIVRRKLEPMEDDEEKEDAPAVDPRKLALSKDHRNLSVRSIIDMHLWNRAGWTGTAFADWGAALSTCNRLALHRRRRCQEDL